MVKIELPEESLAMIKKLAQRFIWWKTPEEAMEYPYKIIASVMDIGTFEDVETLAALLGEDILRKVLDGAEAGQLRPRSWYYWQFRLNHLTGDNVPPVPRRTFE